MTTIQELEAQLEQEKAELAAAEALLVAAQEEEAAKEAEKNKKELLKERVKKIVYFRECMNKLGLDIANDAVYKELLIVNEDIPAIEALEAVMPEVVAEVEAMKAKESQQENLRKAGVNPIKFMEAYFEEKNGNLDPMIDLLAKYNNR